MDLFEYQAMQEVGAQVSLVFVPPRFVKAAVIEAIDARIGLCVVSGSSAPSRRTRNLDWPPLPTANPAPGSLYAAAGLARARPLGGVHHRIDRCAAPTSGTVAQRHRELTSLRRSATLWLREIVGR